MKKFDVVRFAREAKTMDDETLLAVLAIGLALLYTSPSAQATISDLLAPLLGPGWLGQVPTPGDGGGTSPYSPPPIVQPPVNPTDPGVPPAPVYNPPPVAQPPTAGGGNAGDMIDLASAAFCAGLPEEIKSWPVTVQLAITNLSPITPSFALPDSWPDVIPPGFEGPIAYTVCAGMVINGVWTIGGFIEMWRGRGDCGNNDAGSFEAQLAQNWWYYAPPLAGNMPGPGSQVAFMVVPGDARMGKGPFPVAERSNVVLVQL